MKLMEEIIALQTKCRKCLVPSRDRLSRELIRMWGFSCTENEDIYLCIRFEPTKEEIVVYKRLEYREYATLKIGVSPAGVWTYGITYCARETGYSSPLSVWNEPFTSRHDVVQAGLQYLRKRLTADYAWYGNRENVSKPVLMKMIEATDLRLRDLQQPELFEMCGGWR